MEMLIRLDRDGGYFQETSSSLVGDPMLRSPVPSTRCAFDRLGPALLDGANGVGMISLTAACLRPGKGKENFEVRPIVSDKVQAGVGGFKPVQHQTKPVTTTTTTTLKPPTLNSLTIRTRKYLSLSIRHVFRGEVFKSSVLTQNLHRVAVSKAILGREEAQNTQLNSLLTVVDRS
jgi:hypothetical protein